MPSLRPILTVGLFAVLGSTALPGQIAPPMARVLASERVPGGALQFDGTALLTAPDIPQFRFDKDDSFTIEAWYKPSTTSVSFIKRTNSYVLRQVGDRISFQTTINFNGDRERLDSNATITPNEWVHVAAVYEAGAGSGAGIKRLYINGVLDNSAEATELRSSANPLEIQGPNNGCLDSVRVWNVARTLPEMLADADRKLSVIDPQGGTPDRPLPGLLADWRFDAVTVGRVPDRSGEGRDLTGLVGPSDVVEGLLFRDPAPLATVPDAALQSTGMSTKMTVADQDLLDLTTGLTLEAWVLLDPLTAPRTQVIVGKGDAWRLSLDPDSRLAFLTDDGNGAQTLTGDSPLVPGRWYHVAATWDGTSKELFLDALPDGSADWTGPLTTNGDPLVVGAETAAATTTLDGLLDEVRVWGLAKSQEALEANRWRQLRGFENCLRALWSFDRIESRTVIDTSYGSHDGTLVGFTSRVPGLALTPLSPPIANVPGPDGGAYYFPGDLAQKTSLVLPADPLLDPREGLTVESWISISSVGNKTRGIITKGSAWGLLLDPQGRLVFRTRRGTFNDDLPSSAPLELDRWYHVAAVFDGSDKHLVIDGAIDASQPFTGLLENLLASDLPGSIAFSGNYDPATLQVPFHGRLDTVRIWSQPRTLDELQSEATRELRGTEPGLLGCWRFDGSAPLRDHGRNRFDAVAGAQPAELAPIAVDGLPFDLPLDGALALEFNWEAGTSDVGNLGTDSRLDFGELMTAEFWLYLEAIPEVGESFALVSKGEGAWEVSLEDNGKINFHTAGVTLDDLLDENNQPKPGTPFPTLLSTGRIEPGAWYHVAVVWDGTGENGRKEIYLNGQLDNERNDYAPGSPATSTRPLLLAARPLNDAGTTVTNAFPGILDELRLWNLAQPGLQIRSTFDNELVGDELGLVGYWPFNQGGRNPDRSESLTILDQDGSMRSGIDGVFSSGMGILNRVPGILLGPPVARQYSLSFNGTDEYLEVAFDPSLQVGGDSLTLEAWVNPTGNGFRTILMQGDHGYGLAIDADNKLRYFVDGNTLNALSSTGSVANGQWQHVAVVVDGVAGTTTFYINGQQAGVSPGATVTVRPSEPLFIGKQGPFGTNFYQGQLDEVRIWFSARTPTEMNFFALQELSSGDLPGLAAYWNMNEGRGLVAGNATPGPDAAFNNLDATNWRPGHVFPDGSIGDGLNLSPSPDAKGLWIGTIILDRVNEVQTAIGGESNELSPTGDTLRVRIILHADESGALRLLKDVVIMSALTDPADPESPRRLVLVTNPLLIPHFDGVVERGGKLVGLRYGTVDYEFAELDLPMLGGISAGADAAGRITLAATHPNNPFRHKYHPQHRDGFEITRQFALNFDTAPEDPAAAPPGFGTQWITGTYNETIAGLHKIPLKTAGRFELTRLNDVGTLNE